MSELDVRMLVRAFLEVFPHASLWEEGSLGPLLVVGTKRPLRIDAAELTRRMQAEPVRKDLVRLGFPLPAELFRFYIAGAERLHSWVGDVPSVTDDRTVVDFATPTRVQSGFGFGYFRMKAPVAPALRAEQAAVFAAIGRLREPIGPPLTAEGEDR
jgi:hypothetical protein